MPNGPNGTTELKSPVLDGLKSLQRWTIVLFVLLAAVTVTVFVVRSIDLAHVEEAAAQNRTALCALRADLRDRVQTAKRFLLQHPEGVAGIPPSQIRKSISNQERTIEALKVVDCSQINVDLGRDGI